MNAEHMHTIRAVLRDALTVQQGTLDRAVKTRDERGKAYTEACVYVREQQSRVAQLLDVIQSWPTPAKETATTEHLPTRSALADSL